jgi:hypothetical protein
MKKKKKSLIAKLALVCSLAALVLSALGLVIVPEDQSHLIDDLYAENQHLQERMEALETELEQLMTAVNLQSWTLNVTPWVDNTGADVVLTATPTGHQAGVSATFLVMLEGRQVQAIPCIWDGSAFTATAGVSAADGYGYYLMLTSPAGTQQLPLADPDSPESAVAVYLQSSLSSYCNLVVNDWLENPGSALVLTDAYAQVQLPRVSAVGKVEIDKAEVVLRVNDSESIRIPIKLRPSEVAGSYELVITDLQIPMPELTESDVMELFLEVSLTDGRRLSAFGVTWHLENEKLTSAVG